MVGGDRVEPPTAGSKCVPGQVSDSLILGWSFLNSRSFKANLIFSYSTLSAYFGYLAKFDHNLTGCCFGVLTPGPSLSHILG